MKSNVKSWINIGFSCAAAVLGILEGVNWLKLTGDATLSGWVITAVAVSNILIRLVINFQQGAATLPEMRCHARLSELHRAYRSRRNNKKRMN